MITSLLAVVVVVAVVVIIVRAIVPDQVKAESTNVIFISSNDPFNIKSIPFVRK